jgi:hypothetical protein
MTLYQANGFRQMALITKRRWRLCQQEWSPRLVRLMAEQAVAGCHGTVNPHSQGGVFFMTRMAQLRHLGHQVHLAGEVPPLPITVTLSTVLHRLMDSPASGPKPAGRIAPIGVNPRVLGHLTRQRWNAIKEHCHHFVAFYVVTACQDQERDRRREPDQEGANLKQHHIGACRFLHMFAIARFPNRLPASDIVLAGLGSTQSIPCYGRAPSRRDNLLSTSFR